MPAASSVIKATYALIKSSGASKVLEVFARIGSSTHLGTRGTGIDAVKAQGGGFGSLGWKYRSSFYRQFWQRICPPNARGRLPTLLEVNTTEPLCADLSSGSKAWVRVKGGIKIDFHHLLKNNRVIHLKWGQYTEQPCIV